MATMDNKGGAVTANDKFRQHGSHIWQSGVLATQIDVFVSHAFVFSSNCTDDRINLSGLRTMLRSQKQTKFHRK